VPVTSANQCAVLSRLGIQYQTDRLGLVTRTAYKTIVSRWRATTSNHQATTSDSFCHTFAIGGSCTGEPLKIRPP
jgi:hypothetical protein